MKINYTLFQIKDIANTPYAFRMYIETFAKSLNKVDYDIVYSGDLELDQLYLNEEASKYAADILFERFNIDHPDDFHGHSMSVSDVVVISDGNKEYILYCDAFGWAIINNENWCCRIRVNWWLNF